MSVSCVLTPADKSLTIHTLCGIQTGFLSGCVMTLNIQH